ncbi:hypothetical protein CHS0354_035088 [Potamilus streckersoni]|uniref:Ig-like domain-containing protein n=1 Tax=Potamilus streckersoni TaxID=2493646 RepID=A0AAE0VQB7_9BIVA|nr:hypothetical protein CHS0354_035088 [Potamilus streckersoni]
MIDSVGKSETDNYTCTMSNGITGRSQCLQTTLVAIYGPSSGQVMLSSFQSITIVEDGTMLNITCSADCYPPCSFTWTGPHSFSQSGAQLSQFVDMNKEGNYICTASNQENLWKSATASVTVIVIYFPDSFMVADHTVQSSSWISFLNSVQRSFASTGHDGPGSSVNLGSNPPTSVNLYQRAPDITCSATCNPPCDYRWYHDRTMYSSGATLSLGVIEKKTSGGNYTCEANNKFLGLDRSSSISVNITIYYGAEIVSLSVLDSKTVNENFSAIFQCQVDSNPLPTITWRKEDINTVLKTESGVVQSQFRIESAQCQNLGNYTCSAYNGIWTQANGTLQSFVKCHPRTDSEVPLERKVYKKVHEAAFLSYTVISYPLPKFTWMFLGNGSQTRDLPGSASVYASERQSELKFTSLNIDDFEYYSVVADNSLPPSAKEVFEIISAELPAPVIRDPQVAAVGGGVVGGIVFVIVIVVVAVILKRWTLKPKMEGKCL